jgi:hypothetical protein
MVARQAAIWQNEHWHTHVNISQVLRAHCIARSPRAQTTLCNSKSACVCKIWFTPGHSEMICKVNLHHCKHESMHYCLVPCASPTTPRLSHNYLGATAAYGLLHETFNHFTKHIELNAASTHLSRVALGCKAVPVLCRGTQDVSTAWLAVSGLSNVTRRPATWRAAGFGR